MRSGTYSRPLTKEIRKDHQERVGAHTDLVVDFRVPLANV